MIDKAEHPAYRQMAATPHTAAFPAVTQELTQGSSVTSAASTESQELMGRMVRPAARSCMRKVCKPTYRTGGDTVTWIKVSNPPCMNPTLVLTQAHE